MPLPGQGRSSSVASGNGHAARNGNGASTASCSASVSPVKGHASAIHSPAGHSSAGDAAPKLRRGLQAAIEPGSASDAAFSVVYQGPSTLSDVKNLQPFTDYEFRVRAMNVSGWSAWSDLQLFKTGCAAPTCPQSLETDGEPFP